MRQINSHRCKLRLIYFTILFFTELMADGNEYNETTAFCTNPAGDRGKCIDFRDCKPLPRALTTDVKFLKNSQCNQHKGSAYICCPDKRHILPEPPHCGVRTTTSLMGVQLIQPDYYSWTALIEHEKLDGSTDFHCGGMLINQGHILTAAHCVRSLPDGWKVYRVLLGEWDLSSVLDCAFNYCNDPPIELKVSKLIVHGEFEARNGSYSHDIALIRFEELLSFPQTIQPICLPLKESIRWEKISHGLSTIAGWGKTPTSAGFSKKHMIDVKIRNYQDCILMLKSWQQVEPNNLCILRDERSSKKICSADSGGGLMWALGRFHYLIGISGGIEYMCGTVDVPGIFINVMDYVDWIRINIK